MKNTLLSIWYLYYDGFRNMTLGKTLWLIILLKLSIMFFILRIFFFPNYLNNISNNSDKGSFVGSELINRAATTVLPNNDK